MKRTSQKTKIAISAVVALCVMSGLAYAQGETDYTDQIKTSIMRYLDDLKKQDSSNSPITQGDILVEHNKMYYAVTLPDIAVMAGKMGQFDIGNIVANISRTDKGNWRVSMAFPQNMTFKQPDGKVNGLLSLGKQNITGTWDSEFEFFSVLNAEINDIRFVDSVNRMDLNARLGKRTLTVSKQGERSSTITSNANLYDVSGRLLGKDTAFTAKQITFTTKHSGVLLIPFLNVFKTLIASGEGWSLPTLTALSDTFTDGEQTMVLNDLHYEGGAGGLNGDVRLAKFSSTIKTAENDQKNYGVQAEWSGISPASKATPVYPESIMLDASINGVEKGQLENILSALQSEPKGVDINGLMDALQATSTQLQLNGFEIVTNNGSRFKVSGTMVPYPSSPRKWAGKVNIAITGIESFAQSMAQMGEAGESDSAHKLQAVSMQLQMVTMMMQSIGTMTKNAAGQTVVTIALELNPDGKILVNGQEVQSSFGLDMDEGAESGMIQDSAPQDIAPAP